MILKKTSLLLSVTLMLRCSVGPVSGFSAAIGLPFSSDPDMLVLLEYVSRYGLEKRTWGVRRVRLGSVCSEGPEKALCKDYQPRERSNAVLHVVKTERLYLFTAGLFDNSWRDKSVGEWATRDGVGVVRVGTRIDR